MTLVVSEVSARFGCVLVGDSAFTIRKPGREPIVRFGAAKIHYSAAANIGFALWGNAAFGTRSLDTIVDAFATSLSRDRTPSSAGEALASLLAEEGEKSGRDWSQLRGGAHIAGYESGKPALYHVHTGDEPPAEQHPPRLHRDSDAFPYGMQLRNGHYKMFAPLFSGMEQYATSLREMGWSWPFGSLEDRVTFYEIGVRAVADTLVAAGRLPAVGGTVSAVAFDQGGLRVDKRLALGEVHDLSDGDLAEYGARLPNDGCYCRGDHETALGLGARRSPRSGLRPEVEPLRGVGEGRGG